MSFAQRLWSSTGSADRPMIFTPRLSNSAFMRAIVPSSVVHTGVKSLGWENSTAHLSPIHWWKSICPSVVCALKLGAVSPIRNAMTTLLLEGRSNLLRWIPPRHHAGGMGMSKFPAEMQRCQDQRDSLQQAAEVHRRADAPVALRQVGHHGEKRRPDGGSDDRGQAVQP